MKIGGKQQNGIIKCRYVSWMISEDERIDNEVEVRIVIARIQ